MVRYFGSPSKPMHVLKSCHHWGLNLGTKCKSFDSMLLHTCKYMHSASLIVTITVVHKLILSSPFAFISTLLSLIMFPNLVLLFFVLFFPWKCLGNFSFHKHWFWETHKSTLYVLTCKSLTILYSVSSVCSSSHIMVKNTVPPELLVVLGDRQSNKLHGMM